MILFFAKLRTRTKRCVTQAQEKKMLDSQTKTRKYYQENKNLHYEIASSFWGPNFFGVKLSLILL